MGRLPNRGLGLVLAGLLVLAGPQVGIAQEQSPQAATEPLRGRVLLGGGQPVADVPVRLHRITSSEAGEIAAATTNSRGEFEFVLEPAPGASFNLFLTTADYRSVQYFGPPLHQSLPEGEYVLEVFDTTSVLPEPLRVSRRDVVLVPERSGAWEVNEIVRVRNPGALALVAGQTGTSWEFPIPAAAINFEADGGGLLPHRLARVEDRVVVLTPIAPGEQELVVRYRIPASPTRTSLLLEASTDTLNLFVRQPSHLLTASGLETTRLFEVEDERYLQYAGLDLPEGTQIDLRWRNPGPPVDPILAAATVTLLLLGLGVWAARRNRAPRPDEPVG